MGKFKGGMNQKAASAADRQAANQAQQDAKAAAAREKELQAEWSKGANTRADQRKEQAESKADEADRKRREKAALLAEEDANLGSGGKAKKIPTLSKGKGKKKNDLSLLEDALVGAADKKVKAKRKSEKEREQKIKEEQARKQAEQKPMDPLLANTEQMIAGTEDQLVGRAANKALDADGAASGIDGAIESLNIFSGPVAVPSQKALYKAFEERNLPQLKEDFPNLKLSQYKDKLFQLWKKSPENPANQVQ